MTHTEKTRLWELIHKWREEYELRRAAGWPRVQSSPLALTEDAIMSHIARLCLADYRRGYDDAIKEQEAQNG